MKKLLLVFSLAIAGLLPAARLSAQSANLVYGGVPTGPLMPGSSFTVAVSLAFTAGGTINNVQGLSLWLAQRSPSSPFPFSITNRDGTGSVFAGSNLLAYPQVLNPINTNASGVSQQNTDLGGLATNSLPSGTYFLANFTFAISGNVTPGSYTLGNTTSTVPGVGGRISVINNNNGDTFLIAPSNFTVAIVPEPGSVALIAIGALGAGLGFCRGGLRWR